MARLSVMVPFSPNRAEQVLAYTVLVRRMGAERLWHGQSLTLKTNLAFAFAAGAGTPVPTGIGIDLMPLHTPYAAALQARSLAACTGYPTVAGFGPGTPAIQEALLGTPYRSPLTATREYVHVVRGLLNGGMVERSGEYFPIAAKLPPLAVPEIRIGLGVLRPRMAMVAGELADVAITWLTPPDYIRDVLIPEMRKGAANTGRRRPSVTAIVPVALESKEPVLLETVLAAASNHLQGDNYVSMLGKAGIEVRGEAPEKIARRLVECRVFAGGTLEHVVSVLAEYRRAGVDEIVLSANGVHNVRGQYN